MLPLDASAVGKLLRELGQRAALHGDNPYRARAYLRAAESLLALPEPLEDVVAQNRLQEIPGIGKAIAEIVTKLHLEGSHPALDTLREEVPAGVLEMLHVPGLRPDKAMKIHKELGINSLDELETAAREGRLAAIKGLGAALQTKILQGISISREHADRYHLHRAADLLEGAETQLRRFPQVKRITPAGDFRRGSELCSRLSLVAEVGRREG